MRLWLSLVEHCLETEDDEGIEAVLLNEGAPRNKVTGPNESCYDAFYLAFIVF